MTNNDFLRRLRYALNIKDNVMLEIFKMGKIKLDRDNLLAYLSKEEDENFRKINNKDLLSFLDGLITYNRGVKDEAKEEKKDGNKLTEIKVTKNNLNNIILRKLRIALELKSYDMIKVFKLGGVTISEGELSALFRKEDHKNYRECGDKYIRVFLKGLIEYYRD